MFMRRKLLAALLLVALLVALLSPLARYLTETLAAQQAQNDALLAMHEEHTAHKAEGYGNAVQEIIDIEDPEVPLADVPTTGDPAVLWMALTGISAIGLTGLGIARKKKED